MMERDQFASAIKSEIEWCEQHSDPAKTPEQAEWFIKGLKQALLLIEKVTDGWERIDSLNPPDFIQTC